jgi:energy-coupling factor transport system substrate-specific component
MKHNSKNRLTVSEMTVFGMLGALMFCSKILMEVLPNIHVLGMLTMVYTLVYRKKALFPIYVYVLLNGVFSGFATWWIPYLYIWTILWAVTMLLPKKMPTAVASIVYPLVCCLHGLSFGILYAPMQALLYGFDFEQMIAWIMTGVTFDVIHAVGNFAGGLLILPMVKLLKKIESFSL